LYVESGKTIKAKFKSNDFMNSQNLLLKTSEISKPDGLSITTDWAGAVTPDTIILAV